MEHRKGRGLARHAYAHGGLGDFLGSRRKVPCLGFRVDGLGFGVWGLWFGVWGLWFGVWGFGLGLGLRV